MSLGMAMNSNDRSILSVTCYGHFLSHFNMLVFPAILLPLSKRLEMSMADTLNLAFYMYLLMGITALPWGYLADKIGARPLLTLFYAGAGLSGFAAAVVVDTPGSLRWALAGIGLFSGIYHPAGLGWIACCVSKTSTGMAYNGMFGNLGLAIGPVVAGVINYSVGIQAVYVALGLLNLFGLLLLLRTGRSVERMPKARSGSKAEDASSWSSFAVLLVAMMLGGIVYRGTTVTLPALFEIQGAGIYQWLAKLLQTNLSANVVATAVTSGLYLVGMLGQFTGGKVGERFDLRWSYFFFHLLTIPAALFVALLTDIPLVFMATFHSFFLLGMQPVENTLVARLTPPGTHGSAYGMKFVLTFGVGALAVQLVRSVEQWGGITKSVLSLRPALGMLSTLIFSRTLSTCPAIR